MFFPELIVLTSFVLADLVTIVLAEALGMPSVVTEAKIH